MLPRNSPKANTQVKLSYLPVVAHLRSSTGPSDKIFPHKAKLNCNPYRGMGLAQNPLGLETATRGVRRLPERKENLDIFGNLGKTRQSRSRCQSRSSTRRVFPVLILHTVPVLVAPVFHCISFLYPFRVFGILLYHWLLVPAGWYPKWLRDIHVGFSLPTSHPQSPTGNLITAKRHLHESTYIYKKMHVLYGMVSGHCGRKSPDHQPPRETLECLSDEECWDVFSRKVYLVCSSTAWARPK